MAGNRKHHGPVLAERGELTVIDCEACGYAHLHPLRFPKAGELYGEHAPPDWFDKVRREHEEGWWRPAYDHQVRLLKDAWTLVDWGAGAGWFVHHWLDQYRGVGIGIEPSEDARKAARVPEYLFPDVGRARERYELPLGTTAARASLVLEHLVNPRVFLRGMVSHADARIMVVVPNEFSPLQRRVGGDWFVNRVHLNYFNPWSLRGLFSQAGLRVVHEGATFPMELFILTGKDYRGDDALGRECHALRLKFERKLGRLAFLLYGLMYRAAGWGRELVFVGEKT